MAEIEQKDYQESYNYATDIKNYADTIHDAFTNIDKAMQDLYGENWTSTGADVSNGRFQELKQNFEPFYNNVIAMHNHIGEITGLNQETDSTVSSYVSKV